MVRWRLREIAEPERWNPHNLAEATGLTYKTIWSIWQNKTRRADLDTIAALARTLKVRPGDLLVETESESASG